MSGKVWGQDMQWRNAYNHHIGVSGVQRITLLAAFECSRQDSNLRLRFRRPILLAASTRTFPRALIHKDLAAEIEEPYR